MGDAAALTSIWAKIGGTRCHALVNAAPPADDARAIVLVHGYGVSSRYMMPLAERLAGRYRLLVPDLPGYGISESPERVLDVPGLTDALAEWMSVRRIERAALVGHSFGSQIVAELALRQPRLVSHVVLIGPTTDDRGQSVGRLLWRLFRDALHEPLSLWWTQIIDYLRFGPRFAWGTLRYMLADRIAEKLPRLVMPVLVVRGEHDPIATQVWCERLVEMTKDGSLAVVPGAAHAINYTEPEAVAALIHEFATRVELDAQY